MQATVLVSVVDQPVMITVASCCFRDAYNIIIWFLSWPADKNGHFSAELAPLEVKGKKGKELFDRDEHPRETSLEKLSKLPPVFKENGTVSAGNASVSPFGTVSYVYMYCTVH